jgi:hypothetical protein
MRMHAAQEARRLPWHPPRAGGRPATDFGQSHWTIRATISLMVSTIRTYFAKPAANTEVLEIEPARHGMSQWRAGARK